MQNPGTFERRVSFCAVTSTKSAMGAPSKTYTHSFYLMMSRESAGQGQEQYLNNRLVVPVRYIYRGHYRTVIDETYQIVDGGEKFNILSINPIERNMFIEILAEKITE
jgi:hypothetical protein